MFRFFFSAVDALSKSMTESPRIMRLLLLFFFTGSAVMIHMWEIPVERASLMSVAALPYCDLRSQSMAYRVTGDQSERVLVSDDCSVAARAWSQRVALQERESDGKEIVFPDASLSTEILSLTAGYPIEFMSASIAKYDRKVAALLVGIAKKESNWGKRVPRSDDGADCFNYWGFKGAGSRGVAMGHGCFGSPEEAVEKVGNRIAELVRLRSTSEPKNFTIWKCGSSCATHSPESVRKWVSDVDQYYRVLAIR